MDNAYDKERGNQVQIAGLDIYFIQKEEKNKKIEFFHKESFKDKKEKDWLRKSAVFFYITNKPWKMQCNANLLLTAITYLWCKVCFKRVKLILIKSKLWKQQKKLQRLLSC